MNVMPLYVMFNLVLDHISSLRKKLGSSLHTSEDFHILKRVLDSLKKRPDKSLEITATDADWDLSELLQYWESKPDNDSLDIQTLRAKVISLGLALSISRPSDLARLDLDTLIRTEEAVSIKVFRGKSTRGKYSAPKTFAFTPERPKCCPASALLRYVQRSSEVRSRIAISHLEGKPLLAFR